MNASAQLPKGLTWHQIVESIPARVYLKNHSGQFIYANRTCVTEHGRKSLKQLLGKTDIDFFEATTADVWLNDECRLIRDKLRKIESEELEQWKDGRQTWALTTKIGLKSRAGKVLAILGFTRQIGEKAELRQALDAGGVGLWYRDLRTKAVWFSPQWKQMIG